MNNSDSLALFTPEIQIAVLTWISFFALLFILYKYAWNPILTGLEKREESIRESVENAQRVKKELAQMEDLYNQRLAQAESESKEIIAQSRRAAMEAAHIIEHKAKEQTKILLETAERRIKELTQEAQFELKKESAHIAVQLAGKLIEENLDTEKNRKLINEFIKHI